MNNNHLEAYRFLSKLLDQRKERARSLKFLQIIIEYQLKSDVSNIEIPAPILRKTLYAKVTKTKLEDVDEKLAQKIKKDDLQNKLEEVIDAHETGKNYFSDLGLLPKVGETSSDKNEAKQFWIELIEINTSSNVIQADISKINSKADSRAFKDVHTDHGIEKSINEDKYALAKSNELVVEYQRESPEAVKGSYFSKLFFNNNELKIKTVKGIGFMLLLMVSFLANIFFAVVFIWLFIDALNSDRAELSFINILLMLGFVAYAYFTYRFVYKPLHSLPRTRIVKAPDFLISTNQFNAELELFRPTDYNIARITEYISTCPICNSKIELDYGKPDHKYYMVGRCRGDPHAHVYSFDRILMKGYFLGHEGYFDH